MEGTVAKRQGWFRGGTTLPLLRATFPKGEASPPCPNAKISPDAIAGGVVHLTDAISYPSPAVICAAGSVA